MSTNDDPAWALRPNEQLPRAPLLWTYTTNNDGLLHYLVSVPPPAGMEGWVRSSDDRPPISPDGTGWAINAEMRL